MNQGNSRSGDDEVIEHFHSVGFELTETHLKRLRELIRAHRGGTRREIAVAACREWDWRRPNGELRLRACQDVLRRLEKAKHITLPPARRSNRATSCASGTPKLREQVDRQEAAEQLDDIVLRKLIVRPVKHVELTRWRELMARHHYLGEGVSEYWCNRPRGSGALQRLQGGKSVREEDGELTEDGWPVRDGAGPFPLELLDAKVEELHRRVIVGEMTASLDEPSEA